MIRETALRLALLLGLALPGCGARPTSAAGDGAAAGNHAPELLPVDPQVCYVGLRCEIEFQARDLDRDNLVWDCQITGPDGPGHRLHMTSYGEKALVVFTPLASDVGQHELDVGVTDGTSQDRISVPLTVVDKG